MSLSRIFLAVAALIWTTATQAQNAFPTPQGSNANGSVIMCPSATDTALYVPCGSSSSSGTTVNSVKASATAKGLAITLGGTSQTILAANTSRKAFIIQNPCSATEQGIAAAEDLAINFTSPASLTSSANVVVLAPCSSFSMGITAGVVTTELITGIAATTSHVIYIKEF